MDWQTFANEFTTRFTTPFLPEGFVEAKIITPDKGNSYVNIRIGDRDIDVEADGKISGSGTNVGVAQEWIVKKKRG